MRRDQLEHAIRAACQIIGAHEVIVVGSQAILGTYTEAELPPAATMSREIDVLPFGDDPAEVTLLADAIVGVAGEWSMFEESHGFSIDGVDLSTATLPRGWRGRLIRVQNENTVAPGTAEGFIGWRLDKEDLCVAKLYAFRDKDKAFVKALLHAGLVDGAVIDQRLGELETADQTGAVRPRQWLRSILDLPQ